MNKKIKLKKIETIPQHRKYVQVTDENFHDLKTWMGANEITIRQQDCRPLELHYGFPDGGAVTVTVGDYIVRFRTEESARTRAQYGGRKYSYRSYTKDAIKTGFRKGWS